MKLKLYQIDAFTDKVFGGNPAAVCILEKWLEDNIMQHIAQENNLAETAFAVKMKNAYEIRWFTPETEVDLCGHATLATAYVVFNHYETNIDTIRFFSSKSGDLTVVKKADMLQLDFPRDRFHQVEAPKGIIEAVGLEPLEVYLGKTDYMLIYKSQKAIESIKPNFHLLDQINCRGVIVTAPGDQVDFVSRFFAPLCGIPEDPVTGSAHTTLTPYWSKVLGKKALKAHQLSSRGGQLYCEDHGELIKIAGKAVPYLIGEIEF
ncbi:MAG: PhzF family phenazine biosynthesis protein [Croceitalea sp.]|nr:PhzF family phenazine biosynthesis protein [Croceitalea sp.]NNC34001.1 PhzF family phenazine biosynthesis protein [Croceitalea sp.]NNL09684.1 PhzF family phenazine biosynthesis protein [Croceitalea sp.]